MSEEHKNIEAVASNNGKMIFAMGTIGIICAFLIVLTYESTKETIDANKSKALEKAVFNVIPDIKTVKTFQLNSDQTFSEMKVNNPNAEKVLAGYDEKGECKGVAFKGTGKGYGDVLSLLFGYDPIKQQIIGFYVLETKETPGIGDKISIEPFLSNFKAMEVTLNEDMSALKNEVKTVKHGEKNNSWEIDGITGATITSRGVGNILNKSSKEWLPKIFKNKDTFNQMPKLKDEPVQSK